MHKDFLNLLGVYCQVIEQGNFTQAAEALDIQAPAVSKAVAKLESITGCKLLNRSTRGIEMTDAGKVLYHRGVEQLLSIDNLLEEVSSSQSVIQGTLKLTATPAIGEELIAPVIPSFRRRYPELNVELLLSNELATLPSQNIDVALRSSDKLEDSSLISAKLFELQRLLVASPEYVAKFGPLAKVEDIQPMESLVFKHRRPLLSWPYTNEQQRGLVSLTPGVYTNSYRALTTMCLKGAGIARLFRYQVEPYLKKGQLLTVLEELDWGTQSVHAVYHQRLSGALKLNVFLDYLIEQLPPESPELKGP